MSIGKMYNNKVKIYLFLSMLVYNIMLLVYKFKNLIIWGDFS